MENLQNNLVILILITLSSKGLSQVAVPGDSSTKSAPTASSTPMSTTTTSPATNEPTVIAYSTDSETNNCICVPQYSCQSIYNGNATEPETDGGGMIEARIISSQNLNYEKFGVNSSITSPLATGTAVKSFSPTFCPKDVDLLELCCPVTKFRCGIAVPTIPTSKEPPVGSAKFGQFPWLAIIFTFKQFFVGTGVLIDQYHVLSVAHRFEKFAKNMTYKVRLGDWDTAATYEPLPHMEFNVSKIFKHPKFNATNLKSNLIMLRLASSVPLGLYPTITTACLPATPIPPPTRCWISGFGQNDFVTGTNQAIMKAIDLPIVDAVSCQKRLRRTALKKNFQLDTKSFMCAGGEPGKDACTGDGGTPLVCNVAGQWYVQGLVAWGIECGSDVPGVYMNISNFIPWIRSVTSI